jgi:hypothetical protein
MYGLPGCSFFAMKTKHIFDELIETTESELAKTSGSSCCQPVSTMIVPVNHKLFVHQSLGEFRVAAMCSPSPWAI